MLMLWMLVYGTLCPNSKVKWHDGACTQCRSVYLYVVVMVVLYKRHRLSVVFLLVSVIAICVCRGAAAAVLFQKFRKTRSFRSTGNSSHSIEFAFPNRSRGLVITVREKAIGTWIWQRGNSSTTVIRQYPHLVMSVIMGCAIASVHLQY